MKTGHTLQYNNISLTWFGHDSFKIKFGDQVVYIDPYEVLSGEEADIIFITHEHFDHCDPNSVRALSGPSTVIIAPHDAASKLPFPNIQIVHPNAEFTEHGLRFRVVPAYNINKSYHKPSESHVGYLIKIDNTVIYDAGDTDLIPEMAQLGRVDIALLPISGTYTMTAKEAAEAVNVIKPEITIPMHYGILPDVTADPREFKNFVGNASQVEILE